jgi:hypothetical protein
MTALSDTQQKLLDTMNSRPADSCVYVGRAFIDHGTFVSARSSTIDALVAIGELEWDIRGYRASRTNEAVRKARAEEERRLAEDEAMAILSITRELQTAK